MYIHLLLLNYTYVHICVQVRASWPPERGATECPPGHHSPRSHRQLPGEGPGGWADSAHPKTAGVFVHVLDPSSYNSGSTGASCLQTTKGDIDMFSPFYCMITKHAQSENCVFCHISFFKFTFTFLTLSFCFPLFLTHILYIHASY